MKKMMAVMTALAALGLVSAGIVWADPVPGNDNDSLTISVSPNIDYGVDITTTSAMMDLGFVNLQESTWTVKPATVTIKGTDATQEVELSATIGPTWNFDISPSTDSSSCEGNAMAVYVLFTETSKSDPPTGDEFAAGAAAAGLNAAGQSYPQTRVGGAGEGTKFEYQGAATQMDDLAPNDEKHMWWLLRLPGTTTVSTTHNVTITLTAVDAS